VAPKLETLRIGVVNGPNLNLLGRREPEVYGSATLADLDRSLVELGRALGAEVTTFQANAEGEIVDRIQGLAAHADGLVINAGAYTHTSIAIRDALLAVALPFVEVHLSNVFTREPFRHQSYLSDRAVGVVVGFGPDSYLLGLRGLVDFLHRTGAS
jgi:3-dehydroquinate dehydratase-2